MGGSIILFWIKLQRNDFIFSLLKFVRKLNNIFHTKYLKKYKKHWEHPKNIKNTNISPFLRHTKFVGSEKCGNDFLKTVWIRHNFTAAQLQHGLFCNKQNLTFKRVQCNILAWQKHKIFYNRSTNSAAFVHFSECLYHPSSLLCNSYN